jgi:PHD/YefM family antitoxin component YafN of YafNO toxin-antitoxin module
MPTRTLLPENIHPLTDFLRHHKRHLQRLKRSQRPAVLTLNGKAQVVVQDAKAYQTMMETMEAMETQKGIAEGIASMERGQGQPAETVFARLRKKHGLKATHQ